MSTDSDWRLILHGRASGAFDMAADEALLEAVSEGSSGPVIRFYLFEHDTLSVGRFQRVIDEFDLREIEARGIKLVRRPTGGRAVLHNHELTYSVVMGREHIRPFSKRRVYAFIVPLLLAGLERLGLPGAVNSESKGDPTSPDCFASTGEYEIDSSAGRKLIGSAQMITRQAVLQHGSLPVESRDRDISGLLLPGLSGRETETPLHESTSIADELGRVPGIDEVREAFAAAVRTALPCSESELTEHELRRTEILIREKYGTTTWNSMQ